MSDDVIERARAWADECAEHVPSLQIVIVASELSMICTALLAADERARALIEATQRERDRAQAIIGAAHKLGAPMPWNIFLRGGAPDTDAIAAAIRARGQAKADVAPTQPQP